MSAPLLPEDPAPPSSPSIGDSSLPLAERVRILEESPTDEGPQFLPATPPAVDRYPFWGWLDLLLFVGILVATMFAAAILVSGFNFGIVAAGYPQFSLSLAQVAVLLQLLGFGPALFLLSRILRGRYHQGLRAAVQLKPMRQIGLYAGVGLATAMLVSALNIVFKLQDLDMPMNELIKSDADLISIGIAAFTFGPLFEEIIFRGFLQPLFVKGIGPIAGILATAVLFALPHGAQYGWHWQLVVIITIAGFVFGVIRWRAESTTASTIAHAAYNGLLLLGAVIQRFQGNL
ncbi:MAG: CPBP family intramembrane metalloprotease [Bryobacterales bacterium]|nr:CPBP family intramembrane metalloprotease [Bryobacterales bacterium]